MGIPIRERGKSNGNKEKLKSKLDAVPVRFGGGYKAKMCARKTVDTLDVVGEMAALYD